MDIIYTITTIFILQLGQTQDKWTDIFDMHEEGHLAYCRGYVRNTFISELFHRLIAAREYFPTCSLSLK